MRPFTKSLFLVVALAQGFRLHAKENSRVETLILDTHQVTISVPEGFVYSSGRDDQGVLMAKLTDTKQKIDLQVRFQPDPNSDLGSEAKQMEFLATVCRQYAETSVEKGYDFKSLAPHRGTGTYCRFTDASLVGKLPVPRGEFLTITQGVKSWTGWVLVFTVLSNDPDSKEYQTALKLVKESFEEAVAPAAKT